MHISVIILILMSFILRGLAANGGVRVVATDTTRVVSEAQKRHKATPTATAALGRTLTASVLLTHVLLKNFKDRLTLRILGNGPLGSIVTEAGLDGLVRGYVSNSTVNLPLNKVNKIDVGKAVGEGEVEVIRSLAPHGEMYTSSVELVSGEIAEDVVMYLAKSEQVNSAVLLGVYLDHEMVTRSGGIILQALPEVKHSALTILETNVGQFGQLTEAMGHMTLLEIMEKLCWGLGLEILTDNALPIKFSCRCSLERVLSALSTLSEQEREDMVNKDGGAEVVCHWCNERYWISSEKLKFGTIR